MRARLSWAFWVLAACGAEEAAAPIAEEPAPAAAQEPAAVEPPVVEPPVVEPAAGPPPEVERPYDEGADASSAIDAAIARAGAEDKRVLLMFGGNWCIWCRRLEWVLRNEPRVAAAIAEGWLVVHVDTGARGAGANAAIASRYGDPQQHGLPVLVVLDGQGRQVHTQETGSLEVGDRHDPERVLAFLTRYRR